MQGWMPKKGWRLASSEWLLALLIVLHGAAPTSHQLPSNNLRPLLVSLASDCRPTLRPFNFSRQFPSVRFEARPLAGPPDRASEQDLPAAILPIGIAWTAKRGPSRRRGSTTGNNFDAKFRVLLRRALLRRLRELVPLLSGTSHIDRHIVRP